MQVQPAGACDRSERHRRLDRRPRVIAVDGDVAVVSRYFATYDLVCAPVVDADGHYCGAISKGRLLTRLQGESHE